MVYVKKNEYIDNLSVTPSQFCQVHGFPAELGNFYMVAAGSFCSQRVDVTPLFDAISTSWNEMFTGGPLPGSRLGYFWP